MYRIHRHFCYSTIKNDGDTTLVANEEGES